MVDMISPPPSPVYDFAPVILTDDRGMIVDDVQTHPDPNHVVAVRKRRVLRNPRRKVTYVSKHFTEESLHDVEVKPEEVIENLSVVAQLSSPPVTPARVAVQSRVYYGLNVDDLSSDSDLTDVPDDIGPDPFARSERRSVKTELQAVKVKSKSRKHPTKSPYFPHAHTHRPRSHFLATLPFPPLSAPKFGLMQERLAHDPFRLLIATIFLNKTPGERAMPVFYQLMEKYSTPQALATAEVADVTAIIRHLGFQNQRARKCVAMAQAWVDNPPEKSRRYRKLNYPVKGDGRNIKDDEIVSDNDERIAWEISHLPGVGPYSHDSWRMFCRDELRGLASSWLGEDAEAGFEPEWKRVVATDKELRAYLTWMWLKEGWVWNKETGQRTKADEELMMIAMGGGVVLEEREKNTLTVQPVDEEIVEQKKAVGKVEKPAGEFLNDTE